jgi:hypothetical protein
VSRYLCLFLSMKDDGRFSYMLVAHPVFTPGFHP